MGQMKRKRPKHPPRRPPPLGVYNLFSPTFSFDLKRTLYRKVYNPSTLGPSERAKPKREQINAFPRRYRLNQRALP